MFGVYVVTWVIGFVLGVIYVELTWDEEIELKDMKFRQSRRNIKG